MIITLNQTGVLRSDQCPTKFFSNTLELVATIRENCKFDMIRAKRYGAKSKQVDLFGSNLARNS